ncbi:hypothetical protein MP213Fo_02170 [Pseudochrobactrum sp. MP213Fo]
MKPAMPHLYIPVLFSAFMLIATLAQAQISNTGNAKAGEKIYLKCRSCHVLDQPTNKMGPHLMNLMGRKAGNIEGFEYSAAMKAAGEDGLTWDEDSLKTFLSSPKTMIPNTSMRFWGLWENQIDDLLAYLREKQQD